MHMHANINLHITTKLSNSRIQYDTIIYLKPCKKFIDVQLILHTFSTNSNVNTSVCIRREQHEKLKFYVLYIISIYIAACECIELTFSWALS